MLTGHDLHAWHAACCALASGHAVNWAAKVASRLCARSMALQVVL
jgi:hypothetical protein